MDERERLKLERKKTEVRQAAKEAKVALDRTHGYALVDGYLEKVSNHRVEPPSLFRGRGEHPKTGTLKQRVVPEQIVINIGKGVPIPKAPDGHEWKGIVHDNTVTTTFSSSMHPKNCS